MDPRTSVLTSKWAPELNFEVKIVPKWRPGGPLETPRAYFWRPRGDVGAPGRKMEALEEHFGALGAASGPLGSAPGTVLGAFLVVFGMMLEYVLRVRWLQESISILVVVRTLFYAFS